MIRRNKCFVPGCNTGCNLGAKPELNDGLNKKTLFKAPEDKNLLERWRRNIPKVGKYLIPGIFVCEIHFSPDSIERFKECPTGDGKMTLVRRSTPILKPCAVPTIFPNLPVSLVETLKKIEPPCGLPLKMPQLQRRMPTKPPKPPDLNMSDCENDGEMPVNDNEISSSHPDSEHQFDSSKSELPSRNKSSSDNSVSSSTQISSIIPGEELKTPVSTPKIAFCERTRHRNQNNLLKKIKNKTKLPLKKGSSDSPTTTVSESKEDDMAIFKSSTGDVEGVDSVSEKSVPFDDKYQILVAGFDSDEAPFSFQKLKSDIFELTMPTPQWSHSCLNEAVAFIDWGWYYETRKKIIVTKNLMYRIFVRDKEIKLEGYDGPKSLEDVNQMLQMVEAIPVCWGMGSERGWSKNCSGHVPYREGPVQNAVKKKCDACLEEMKATPGMKKKEARKRQRLLKLVNELSSERSKNKYLFGMVQKLKRKNMLLSAKLSCLESPEESLATIEGNEKINLDDVINKEFALPENSDTELCELDFDLPDS